MDSNIPPQVVVTALIGQVINALRAGQIQAAPLNASPMNERDVITFITRPMWNVFLAGLNLPHDSKPTEWKGVDTLRVYGSQTHVIESEEFWSFSRAMIK